MVWEKIERVDFDPLTTHYQETERTSVPNGWLVQTIIYESLGNPLSVSIAFVPDRNDEWDLDEP